MKIESTDQDIRNLLSSGYYRIPRFQRPYSWTRENIQEFWDDVVRDRPTDYFIGSMVTFEEGNQRYAVVDGQQRLATITILLAVLRNKLQAVGFVDLAKGIHGLIERRNIDNKEEFILSTETAYPFFQDHILKFGAPDVVIAPMREEENLQRAFDQFNGLVDNAIATAEAGCAGGEDKRRELVRQKLIEMRDAVLDLKVIFVKLDDEDDAYVIFETLNTRGKDLSLTDLVKNHVSKHLKASSASVDQAKVKWQQILETIEGSSKDLETDTFIHHYWLSKYDYLPAKSLFKEVKRRIGKAECGPFLNSLVSDAGLYRSIHEIAYGKWSKNEQRIAESLHALQLFRVQQQTPCVLSLIRAYRGGRINKKHLEMALVAIERFHFLFTAVTSQRSSGGISGMYASLGRRLFEADTTKSALSVIQELKQKLRDRIPSLGEVKALFPEILQTDMLSKQRALVRYILSAFHREIQPGVITDFEKMTIEHLLPQSQVGQGAATDLVVGQLGNLLLVSPELNEKLSSRSFQEKKRILKTAGYTLPKEVASAEQWGAGEIARRTEGMAVHAYKKLWKI
ncbi:MAG: DUF262 domain-containing HNH endonuclease family protein [Candidatus Acidiferrum sp.]